MRLEVPLRERNVLLTAARYAAIFPERSLDDESLLAARKAVDVILRGLEPNPSFAVDRHWNLVQANESVGILLKEVDASLLAPPINISASLPASAGFHAPNHQLRRMARQYL